jgi:hypothetical protein
MRTLFFRIQIMSDMSDFCRIFRIMSNMDNIKNRIRIHLTPLLKTNTNTDANPSPVSTQTEPVTVAAATRAACGPAAALDNIFIAVPSRAEQISTAAKVCVPSSRERKAPVVGGWEPWIGVIRHWWASEPARPTGTSAATGPESQVSIQYPSLSVIRR